MYFYDSNKGDNYLHTMKSRILSDSRSLTAAVGGCQFTDPSDPGNLQFDWLEVQLKAYRRRGMQVSSTGSSYEEVILMFIRLLLTRYG